MPVIALERAKREERCQIGRATLEFRRRVVMLLIPLARGPTLQNRWPAVSSAELYGPARERHLLFLVSWSLSRMRPTERSVEEER